MTTLQDVITNAWAKRNGYSLFAELDDIEPAPDEFSTDNAPLESDEIPLADAVEACHKIAEKMRQYE